jgi:hypothetical protein
MLRQQRTIHLGCLAHIGAVLLCCLLLYVGIDPLINLFLGIPKRPSVPAYPNGQQAQKWVERRDWGTHGFTTVETTDDRDTVLAYFEQHLGPDR